MDLVEEKTKHVIEADKRTSNKLVFDPICQFMPNFLIFPSDIT